MDKQFALEKQKILKISLVQIIREEYEIILLNSIFDSNFGIKLVFRGGTALRLAYGSPRFSDDLDFSQTEKIKEKDFQTWCKKTARTTPNIELVEALKKYYTLYAKFRIKDPALPQTIGIKIEISIRKEKWEKSKDYILMNLKSEVTPITVLAQTASLERIQKEKQTISPPRIRDIFDLWFIGQSLKKPISLDFGKFKNNQIKRELYRLLPEGKQKLIKTWLSKK